jgi:hypothetical protein
MLLPHNWGSGNSNRMSFKFVSAVILRRVPTMNKRRVPPCSICWIAVAPYFENIPLYMVLGVQVRNNFVHLTWMDVKT